MFEVLPINKKSLNICQDFSRLSPSFVRILIAYNINVNTERNDVNVAEENMNRSWSALKFISLINWQESHPLQMFMALS